MVTVFFATNRNPIGEPPTAFGSELGPVDGANLRFGYAEVDEAALKIKSLHVAPERLVVDDEATESPQFGSSEMFRIAARKMAKHARDTLIYIHGFDFSFEEAITRTAEIKTFLGVDMNLFLFTWPSDGQKIPFFSFESDRDDVVASGDAGARSLMIFDRFLRSLPPEEYCEQRVHLMAHSMGNFALRHAVQGLRRRLGDFLPRLFDTILLMAADEDNDAFEHVDKLKLLPRMAARVAVYHTPRDRSLMISEETKGNPERLGSDGPENSRQLNDKVSVIDVSDALGAAPDVTNHQYYRLNPIVRDDLRAVLANQQPLEIPGRVYLPDVRRYRLIGAVESPPRRRRGTRRDR